MKRKWKIILGFILVLLLAGISYALYIWFMPARDVAGEKAIEIQAAAIFDSFANNEARANTLFLNKAIQVTGTVSDIKKNLAGETVAILQSNDPVFGVNCTFKTDPGVVIRGATITFKGICRSYLSDVIINEGILIKK